ncbi:NAD(P)H-dependent oxidoreductase [uncultured Duncaniella sp.]|uniref:NAD(P)H-dependent oxidoreductase n=1 Tax=uncultured Duncaniella sp. TaxID=2768039 RepID=UPI0025A97417|nr:NAD(P)H-dependent oxidoreductase [uncultured Duncaniella sp.]
MKKVVIVNGSPRKNGNTAALCDAFQDGVQSVAESAEVFRFDLNDYYWCDKNRVSLKIIK